MAVNKNFVVKNGLEVNTNLILADATSNKVGIGSTSPQYTLDVSGGIGATDLNVTSTATVLNELRIGTGGTIFSVIAGPLGVNQYVGIRTSQPTYLLDVRSPVSTGQTALYVQGDVRITGDLDVDDIILDDATISNLTVNETLFVTGTSTFAGFTTFQDYVSIQDGLNISGITTISNTTNSTTFNNGALVIDGGLGVEKNVNIGGNLDVTGNITIGGSFFSLQSQEVLISNKDIILGYTTAISPNDDTANHSGIAIASTEGSPLVSFTASGINTLPDTYKQMMWFRSGTLGFSTDIFGLNYGLAIGTTTVASGVRLAVGSNVTVTDTTINAVNSNISNRINSGITSTQNLQVAGVSTLGTIQISSGIITALSGIVTYYGDGSGLINTPPGTAAGLNGQVQYNNNDNFDGSSNFTFDGTTTRILSGIVTTIIGTDLNYSGVGTITTFNSTSGTITNISGTDLNYSGIGTITNLSGTNANFVGVITATDFNSTSDKTLKTNIHTIDNALSTVSQLRGVSFNWKETGNLSYGVIAQELEEILPALVSDTNIRTVNYNGIIGVLIEAIKELKAEIEELKSSK